MIKRIILFLGFIGVICAALGTPGSIIYFIYEWAANDLLFKDSLWEAAKLWLMLVPGGLFVYFIANEIKWSS